MNIELGIGIGSSSLASPTSNDRLIAYAWASALVPSVSTSSVIHKTVNPIIVNSNASALAPTMSSAGNATISAVSANANANVFAPSVAIAGSISVNAVVANGNADSLIPVVSAIRNISVGGVIANSTASAGVPAVSVGGGSSYYLQMDGVDDQISVPSLTFDEVVLDFVSNRKDTGSQYYFNAGGSNGFLYYTGSTDRYGIAWSNAYIDDVQVTNQTNFVPKATRVTLKALMVTPRTAPITFFGIGFEFLKADVYSIKIYNTGVLVAHYDMSTGTVQDQSGNGKHATLTGGTWVVA